MKLSLYVLREHFAPFLYSLCIITFLFVIDFLVKLLDAILSKGLAFTTIFEIFILNMAWMLALSVPMSCLVASLMAFGRLAGDNEITAIRASGISPVKIIMPVFIVSALICCGLIYFNNYVLPEANHRAAAIRNDIARKNAPAFITPGILIKDFPNYRIWVDSINYEESMLFGVKIYFWERRDPPRYMFANQATMGYSQDGKKILITLMDGENHILDNKDPNRYLRLKFRQQTVAIDNVDDTMVRRERNSRSDREMSVKQMYEVVERAREKEMEVKKTYPDKVFNELVAIQKQIVADSNVKVIPRLEEKPWWKVYPISSVYYKRLNNYEKERKYLIDRYTKKLDTQKKQASKYLVEIHKKFSIPVACVIFILVGAPLGIMSRVGGIGMGAIISSAFFLVYWVCLLRGEAMADRLIISPWVSMWAPNIIVGVMGLFLVVRALKGKL
ncbi:MAG: LptF/LptG family permease [Fibrobacteria bacterium]|nr:LptF/LptG family permease [Fibrobacteria bacterium]